MRKMKRWGALLCAVLMAVTLLPTQAWAVEDIPAPCYEVYINPIYADLYSEEDLLAQSEADSYAAPDSFPTFTSEADTVAYIREKLIRRVTSFSVGYWDENDDSSAWYAGFRETARTLFEKATAHDPADPHGGNYLSYQFAGYLISCDFTADWRGYYTFKMTYFTTREQEAEVDKAVSNLLAELKLDGKSDYDKIAAIYDWMCENITYDYANLNDKSYKLKYSAYAALINRTAVCQGYAALLYRLALECGIDAQIITSTNHAWNIAKVGGLFYNLDATWGSSSYFPSIYFLRGGLSSFSDRHPAEEKFLQPEFTSAFPISQLDYGYFDINGDGSGSNIKDVACLYDYLTTGVKNSTFDPGFFSHAADINGDDAIDVYDLQLLYETVCNS